ncbi:MAG TPA: nuclear transport factor 2 family protein [Paraburkholderia sp.]|jgi:ketosteroid isomerase-like protein|nr:nuclear transport factor 2 family protein [Paraburkholderia sp.]
MDDVQLWSDNRIDAVLSRRRAVQGYEERCQYALDLVQIRLAEEGLSRIDEGLRLFAFDAVWEAPTRDVTCRGLEAIKANFERVFRHIEDFSVTPLEQFATPERVFVDSMLRFRIVGNAFDRCPMEAGTRVRMRLLRTFQIADGLIRRETCHEIWEQEHA